jgi:HK97 family phage major capsid protein/HK97 family phage prohead protease
MDRAHSFLEVKALNEETRELTGIASTVRPDRMDDVVEPKGAEFKLPLPFLWQHNHDEPIGHVTSATVKAGSIEVKVKLARVDEPGKLRDRLDEAWQSIKSGLVRGLSIGFRSIESTDIDGSWGRRFLKWEMLELSAVTVPANADCTIQTIKSIDARHLPPASGHKAVASGVRLDTKPGASGSTTTPKPKPMEGTMKTISEQITDLENTRNAKATQAGAIMQKSIDEGRSTDAAESDEFDTIEAELKAIDGDLARLRVLEKINATKATPVNATSTARASDSREGVTVKTHEKLEPGIAFARQAICLIRAKGDHSKAFQFAEKHYPQTENIVKLLKAQSEGANLEDIMRTKATVAAGTTTDSTWAAPLVYAQTTSQDFIEFLRPRTLIGQAAFRPIPFNVRIPRQTSGGASRWVGQGKSKPVTKFDFDAIFTAFTKVAGITVITQELARFSDPSAEALIRDQLADTVIERIDSDLFDPDVAAVANVNPAGLLNGVAPVAGPTGSDPDDIRCALLRLWAPWDATNMGARPAYYTTPAVVRWLAFMRDALGNVAFPGLTANGGTLDGIPVRVSQYLANNGGSGGSPFILVDESEIYLADDGTVTLDASQEATIEMSDTPVGSSSATVTSNGSPFVSMFQTNSIALRAERFIWWGARRSGAVQWIDGFPASC